MSWVERNKPLKDSLQRADGVIYQSEFCRNICDAYLGEAQCPSAVILNGSDPEYYRDVKPAATYFPKVVIAFARWRPHKRLKDMIESFLLAGVEDSMLVVAGDLSRSGVEMKELEAYFELPNILYVGRLNQSQLAPYIKKAMASLHLCWVDACPNSVVEAIVAGVPVITNNVGGTWEIVGPSGGYILGLDESFDLEPIDLYNPPPIDRELVAHTIRLCLSCCPKISCGHVHIKKAADEYLKFMERIL
jgi:glycosyltransferase involved in cell wall biosynthesis